MDTKSSPRPIPVPRSRPLHANSPIPPPSYVLGSDMRYSAYKLICISQTNLEREVGKSEPRLHRLIGHASLFDSARRFITKRPGSKVEEADEAEDLEELESLNEFEEEDDGDDILNISDEEDDAPSALDITYIRHASLTTPHIVSNSFVYENDKHERVSRVIAREIIVNDEQPDEWENASDLSTQAGDEGHDNEDDWSDLTCKDSDDDEPYADKILVDISPTKIPQDDDLILWAQQPRILSHREAQMLIIDTFA